MRDAASGEHRLTFLRPSDTTIFVNGYFAGRFADCINDKLRHKYWRGQEYYVGSYQIDDEIVSHCDDQIYGWVQRYPSQPTYDYGRQYP